MCDISEWNGIWHWLHARICWSWWLVRVNLRRQPYKLWTRYKFVHLDYKIHLLTYEIIIRSRSILQFKFLKFAIIYGLCEEIYIFFRIYFSCIHEHCELRELSLQRVYLFPQICSPRITGICCGVLSKQNKVSTLRILDSLDFSVEGVFSNITLLFTKHDNDWETLTYQLKKIRHMISFAITFSEQECIPVGCVLSAALVISSATHASPLPCHTCPPAMHAPCHTCPPATHAPLPHMPPSHTYPPATHASPATHAPTTHAPMHAPWPHMPPLPCTPPAMHAPPHHTCPPPHMHTPPSHAHPSAMHNPPPWTEWQTGVKHYLSATSFADSNNRIKCV